MKNNDTMQKSKVTPARKAKRTKAIKALNDYIWSLKGKCPMVTEINRSLIMQFCRFEVLANDISKNLQDNMEDLDPLEVKSMLESYESINKIVLQLYKTLQFATIKDESADMGNKFTRMFNESLKEGDF